MSKNGQTQFKNLTANAERFVECALSLGRYALKG